MPLFNFESILYQDKISMMHTCIGALSKTQRAFNVFNKTVCDIMDLNMSVSLRMNSFKVKYGSQDTNNFIKKAWSIHCSLSFTIIILLFWIFCNDNCTSGIPPKYSKIR